MVERGGRDTGVGGTVTGDVTFYNGHDDPEGFVAERRVGRIHYTTSMLTSGKDAITATHNATPASAVGLR
ncbi:MAG: hypothetical protein WCA20_16275 [Candidatus Sulfotelmatobacter sp.]